MTGNLNEDCKTQPNFKTVDIDKRYSHPLIKKGFGMMANYFATRNGLVNTLKKIDYLIFQELS